MCTEQEDEDNIWMVCYERCATYGSCPFMTIGVVNLGSGEVDNAPYYLEIGKDFAMLLS